MKKPFSPVEAMQETQDKHDAAFGVANKTPIEESLSEL